MPYEAPELEITPQGSDLVISEADATKLTDVVDNWDSLPYPVIYSILKDISSQFKTAVEATITVPTLVTPANEATGVALNVTLQWSDVAGAVSYDYQVATDEDFEEIHEQNDVAVSETAVGHMANSTEYFWRVRASTASGTSAYSAARSFTTVAL